MEVRASECKYGNGNDPKLLDIIEVPLLEPKPMKHQSENWLIDSGRKWKKVGSFPQAELLSLTDPVGPLWIDGHAIGNVRNDRIPVASQHRFSSSLRLIRVDWLKLAVLTPGARFDDLRQRLLGRFCHADNEYALWVTDPVYEDRYRAKRNKLHQIGECWLTISLAEREYKGAIYKLIAAIIEP